MSQVVPRSIATAVTPPGNQRRIFTWISKGDVIPNVKGCERKLWVLPPPAPRTLIGGLPKPLSDGHTSKNASIVESGAAFWNQAEGAAKVTGCRKMACVFKRA